MLLLWVVWWPKGKHLPVVVRNVGMDAIQLTSGFKKMVEPRDFRDVWPYFEVYVAGRGQPRYMMSPMVQASTKDYWHGIVDGCLCMLKRRQMMGHPTMYLIVPPIHLQGDVAVEKAVMGKFFDAGVHAHLSPADLVAYGMAVGGANLEHLPLYDEFLYTAGDLASITERSKTARYNCKQARVAGATQVWRGGTGAALLTADEYDQCVGIAHHWREVRTKQWSSKLPYFPRFFNQWANEYPDRYGCWLLVGPGGTVLYYAITEQISSKGISILAALRNYRDTTTVKNPLWAEMQAGGERWAALAGADAWMNKGSSGGDKGLAASKSKFRPCQLMPLYKYGGHKLKYAEWKQTCQSE